MQGRVGPPDPPDVTAGVRRASPALLAGTYAAVWATNVFLQVAFVPSGVWRPWKERTGGWLHPSLVAGALSIAVLG